MYSIWIPTDDDFQRYPHIFFISPYIWDASLLDHDIAPVLLEKIHQVADDSLLKDCMFDNLGSSLMSGTALGCFQGFKPYRD